MEKSNLFFKIFLAFIVCIFFCQLGFSQDAKQITPSPEIVKIYGAPVKIIPSKLNGDVDSLQNTPTTTPKYDRKLTATEKFQYGVDRAFFSATAYVFPLVKSAQQELNENRPNKDVGDKTADGLSRFAINYGTSASKTFLTSGIYPIIFKQNPYYDPSKKRSFRARLLHATSRVFVTKGDNGKLQVNYSRIAGNLSASTLANIWERSTPDHNRIGLNPTFRRFGNMMAFDVVSSIVFKEFGHDIRHFILRH